MPKPQSHSSLHDDELQGVSGVLDITNVATGSPPAENACRSIDTYIFAVWQEPPPSPASRQNTAATILSIDPAGDGASSSV
jgi:hypothetical protein